MHYFPLHIGDYTKDTVGLSLIEHGCYVLLMNWSYANERPLPLDLERLFRICSAIKPADKKAVEMVVQQFFQKEADGYTHKRIIAEIRKFYKKSDAGKANIGKRWHQGDGEDDTKTDTNEPTNTIPNEQATITRVSRTKNQEPRTILAAASQPEGDILELELPETSNTLAQVEDHPPKKKKGGGARERNELLDALAVVGGGSVEAVTRPMWGEAAKALSDIKAVCLEITPEMIRTAAAAYHREWPKASLSPSALAKHWSKFAPGAKKEGGRVVQGIAEPPWDWREVARNLGLCAEQWAMLERVDKIKILREQREGVRP